MSNWSAAQQNDHYSRFMEMKASLQKMAAKEYAPWYIDYLTQCINYLQSTKE